MKIFNAGPIAASYSNGFLRRISHGRTEVLRMMYFALRDHNWNTLPARISGEHIASGDDRFEIGYECVHENAGVAVMKWQVNIIGHPDGKIVFEINGRALEDFRKNRSGFCVLHPLDVTGHACAITHADGSKSTLFFPDQVAADNPFKDIRAMSWNAGGDDYTLSFEGDIFETEDQRNWSDASFKTFCTPLAIPFPVTMEKGTEVFQRVTFQPNQRLAHAESSASVISFQQNGLAGAIPSLGTCASTQIARPSQEAVSMIRAMNLRHYRIEVYPAQQSWVRDFSAACENAYAFGLPLEVALHVTQNFEEELEAFSVISRQNKVRLRKVLLLQEDRLVTSQPVIEQVGKLQAALPNVLFGAGTDYNFNEINKQRFSAANLDFISFSVDPQEHATDDLTILENAETQQHLVRSARAIYGDDMPVHISPITLKKRFNPYATNPADLFVEEAQKSDARQKEAFTALWTFASLCSLVKGGADCATFYQAVGDQGLISPSGDAYPVYEVLKGFSALQKRKATVLESSDPFAAQGLLIDDRVLVLANLSEDEREVRFNGRELLLKPHEIRFSGLHRS